MNTPRYAFFGTGPIAGWVLDELSAASQPPSIVITTPDAPQGRGLQLSPTPVAARAEALGITVWKPAALDAQLQAKLAAEAFDVFVVVDYGQILPTELLALARRGALNVHPSLLPRLRGPSPIRSAILTDERQTGVSIMLLDEEMDHGPLVAQKKIDIADWPPRGRELDELLARAGGKLLADVLPLWVREEIEAHPQNHDVATWSAKIQKEDGLLDLKADARQNLLKIRAFDGWPGTYAFFERGTKKVRVQILDAHLSGQTLVIDRVKPEGKREMSYEDFLRSGAKPL